MKTALIIIDLQNDFLAQLPAGRADDVVEGACQLVEAARAAGAPVIEGTRGAELANGLVPHGDEPVIVKKRYSAFYGTDLEARLAAFGAERVVLAGINIHACIRMAALDAYQRDLRVILPTGAIDGYDDAHNAVTLRYLDGKAARVMTLEEASQALQA